MGAVLLYYRATPEFFDSKRWNAEVNQELESGQALIDGTRNQAVGEWTAKLKDAERRQTESFDARHEAESALVYLRAGYPDVAFPPCACE